MDGYINELKTHPRGMIIADLGCGDAALARALVPQGFNVLSYDLVADGVYVIEADICANIPLPGSEPDEGAGEGHIVDVVICALSLMGSNWPKCIREAWRILKPSCVLFVIPPFHQKRFNGVVQRAAQDRRGHESIRKRRPIRLPRFIGWIQAQIKGTYSMAVRRSFVLTAVSSVRTRATPIS